MRQVFSSMTQSCDPEKMSCALGHAGEHLLPVVRNYDDLLTDTQQTESHNVVSSRAQSGSVLVTHGVV